MSWDRLKAEFQVVKLFYSYHDHRVFFCSHWRLPHRALFVLLRLVLSLYSIFGLVHYFLEVSPHASIMVYFTTWSYILLTCHLALAAILSLVFYRHVHHRMILDADNPRHQSGNAVGHHSTVIAISHRPKDASTTPSSYSTSNNNNTDDNSNNHKNNKSNNTNNKKEPNGLSGSNSNNNSNSNSNSKNSHRGLPDGTESSNSSASLAGPASRSKNRSGRISATPWYFKLSWCLSDINACAAIVVTCIYFSAIFPTVGGEVGLVDTNVHLLNSVFALVDFLASSRPVRLLHVVAPILYGLAWLVFSVVYWATDHRSHVIYDMIDWNRPGVTMGWVLGILAILVCLKLAYFGLHHLKVWLYKVVHEEEYFIDVDRDS